MRGEEERRNLCRRLRARQAEIEAAMLTRVYGVADPTDHGDLDYTEGLRQAVSSAFDFAIGSLERGIDRSATPTALIVQAHLAARYGINLDTVLRRYLAGYTVLGDFIVEEAEAGAIRGGHLQRLLRTQATLFDQVLATVTEEYERETVRRATSSGQRRTDLTRRLLAGELIDASGLGYELDCFHLGLVLSGGDSEDSLRAVAADLASRLLLVQADGSTSWAWLGTRQPLDPVRVGEEIASRSSDLAVAIGEPGDQVVGWRTSHRQAQAALTVVLRSERSFVRYAEVALVAAVLQDEMALQLLVDGFVRPLEDGRDEGRTAKETLRAYFGADHNLTSAAAALGINRRTVASRLRAIEERVGGPLSAVAPELEVALRIEELGIAGMVPETATDR